MAAGDFLIRRNAAETDSITTSNFDSTWDTEVFDQGSSITYTAGVFTVGATAPYLIMYNELFDAASTDRIEVQGEVLINGSVVDAGRGQGYKGFVNANAPSVSSHCILELTSGDTIQVRFYRTDTNAATVVRVVGHGGVQIMQLDNADKFGNYSTNVSATFPLERTRYNLPWNVEDREDTPFTHSADSTDITITESGRYLICVSGDTTTVGEQGRIHILAALQANGVDITGTKMSTVMRGIQGCLAGALSGVFLVDWVANDILTLSTFSEEYFTSATNPTITAGCTIQIWQLPAASNEIIVEATSGNINADAAFVWDTNPYIDSAAFTHTVTTSGITVDADGHYLVMSTLGRTAVVDADPASIPQQKIYVDGVYNLYGSSAMWVKDESNAQGVFGDVSNTAAAILPSLTASQEIAIKTTPLDATHTVDSQTNQFAVVDISSMYAPATTTHVGEGAFDVSGDLSGAAVLDTNGAGTLSATGALAADASLTVVATGSVEAAASLAASAALTTYSTVSLSAAASLQGATTGTVQATASTSASATLVGAAAVTALAVGSVSASATLEGDITFTGASVTLSATASLSGDTVASMLASGSFAAMATLVATEGASVLIVEDGSGVDDANSYITLDYSNEYHVLRNNTDWNGTQEEKESSIVKATDYFEILYKHRFRGTQFNMNGLSFPRTPGTAYYDNRVEIEPLPENVKKAIAELALQLLNGEVTISPLNSGVTSTSASVGSISESKSYDATGSSPYSVHPRFLNGLLKIVYSNRA